MENKDNLLAVDEDMINEVSKINKMMDEEKKKQELEVIKGSKKKSKKEINSITNVENPNSVKEEESKSGTGVNRAHASIKPPIAEKVITMERLHLRVFDDSIDILYRPSHSYISFLPNDEKGKAEVKRIAEMSREEFDKYLDLSICFKKPTKKAVSEIRNTSLETWYKGAWSLNTVNLLKELGVENPIEEPLYIN